MKTPKIEKFNVVMLDKKANKVEVEGELFIAWREVVKHREKSLKDFAEKIKEKFIHSLDGRCHCPDCKGHAIEEFREEIDNLLKEDLK